MLASIEPQSVPVGLWASPTPTWLIRRFDRDAESDCCGPHAASISDRLVLENSMSSGSTLGAVTSCTCPCGCATGIKAPSCLKVRMEESPLCAMAIGG